MTSCKRNASTHQGEGAGTASSSAPPAKTAEGRIRAPFDPGGGPWSEVFAGSVGDEEAGYGVVRRADPAQPTLIALHGRGEAHRGTARGALGWRDDYQLEKAYRRLKKPPLNVADFFGFVAPPRLHALNAALQERAFKGLNVLTPFAPDLKSRSPGAVRPYGRMLVDQLAKAARKVTQANGRMGIDGVSMGGRMALYIGLAHPEKFASIGAMQPAIAVRDADWLSGEAKAVHREHGTRFRLVSSQDDPFLDAVKALASAFERRAVPCDTIVTPGPHDYIWNKGPGSYELLFWHDRILNG